VLVSLFVLLGACRSEQKDGSVVRSEPAVPPQDTVSRYVDGDSLSVDTTVLNETPWDDDSDYIGQLFEAAVGQRPRLAWLLPPNRLLARERHPELVVFGAVGVANAARYVGVVDSAEHRRLSRSENIACEDTAPLAAYEIGSRVLRTSRVLFVTGPSAMQPLSGLDTLMLAPAVVRGIQRRLRWADSGRQRHAAIGIAGGHAYYSLHARYDDNSGDLVESAIVLHDSTGAILALATDDAASYECDGCGVPQDADGLGALFRIMNVFVLPSAPYPLLLSDASTVEGRGLSLQTFTPDGRRVSYSLSEYVVGCILGDSQ